MRGPPAAEEELELLRLLYGSKTMLPALDGDIWYLETALVQVSIRKPSRCYLSNGRFIVVMACKTCKSCMFSKYMDN
jgi:hypothetical protein